MEGTTGIIVSAKLKILDREDQKSISMLSFNTLTAMQEKLEELRNNPAVRNIEFLDDLCSEIIGFAPKLHLSWNMKVQKGHSKRQRLGRFGLQENLPFMLGQKRHLVADDLLCPLSPFRNFAFAQERQCALLW